MPGLYSADLAPLTTDVDGAGVGLDDLEGLFGITAQQEREELFDIIFEELAIDDDDYNAEPMTSGGAAA